MSMGAREGAEPSGGQMTYFSCSFLCVGAGRCRSACQKSEKGGEKTHTHTFEFNPINKGEQRKGVGNGFYLYSSNFLSSSGRRLNPGEDLQE